MRSLVIDATTAEHARGGIGVVANGLLTAIAERGANGLDITVLGGPSQPATGGATTVRPPLAGHSAGRMLFQRIAEPAYLALRGLLDRRPIDGVLYLDSYVPAWQLPVAGPRQTALVHDVLPLSHPQYFQRRKDVFKRLAFRSIARQRPLVLTSTAFTAAEIRRELGLSARVITFGCGQIPDARADALLDEPSPARRPIFLYVGAIEARKDLHTLVNGFALHQRCAPEPAQLAIVGNWRTDEGLEFRRWVRQERIAGVRFLGRLGNGATLDLMAHARALVYPSLAEGFGLPVLEALALGTPVVSSGIEAIRSWARDVPFYFEPGDPVSLAGALAEVSAVGHLPFAARGKELAEGYRWRHMADQVLEAA